MCLFEYSQVFLKDRMPSKETREAVLQIPLVPRAPFSGDEVDCFATTCNSSHRTHLSSAVSGVNSVAAYDLCCWYVAGLVGEGLTCLFVEAGLGEIALIDQGMYKPMGLFLQKTNIIRDVCEDRDDCWRF
jgi:hypothetical protein